MKLKIARSTKSKIVTLELETIEFSDIENKMLNQLGDPSIIIDKNYGSNHIKFSKTIRRGFKTKVLFDAKLDSTKDVANYIDEFLKDVIVEMEKAMAQLEADYEVELQPLKQIIDIKY